MLWTPPPVKTLAVIRFITVAQAGPAVESFSVLTEEREEEEIDSVTFLRLKGEGVPVRIVLRVAGDWTPSSADWDRETGLTVRIFPRRPAAPTWDLEPKEDEHGRP